MAKGKDHHVYVSDEGDDGNDGTEAFPVKTVEAAKRVMLHRGYDKCTGIRLLTAKVYSSPCGQPHCGSCTKANGRRLCPGDGCDKWISVSAKQHAECGWRKPETEKKIPQPEFVYKADDHHGFEKLKRKMISLARQAALQYGWDGLIMGYAAKVGRGGSTARINFVSPQNELYALDERGGLKVQPGLDDHLSVNADNALTLIRQKICPNLYVADRGMIKHDGLLQDHHHHHHDVGDHHHGLPVQGPELPPGMDDASDIHQMQWLQQAAAAEKRAAEMPDLEKGVVGVNVVNVGVPPTPSAIQHAMLAAQHMQMQHQHMHAMGMDQLHLPMEPSVVSTMEEQKRKHHQMMQMEAMHKRSRHEE